MVADKWQVGFDDVYSAIENFVVSLGQNHKPESNTRSKIKISYSRKVELEEQAYCLQTIPVIALTPSTRVGIYLKPSKNSEDMKVAVRLMRPKEDMGGAYMEGAYTKSEITLIKRNQGHITLRNPGLVLLQMRN